MGAASSPDARTSPATATKTSANWSLDQSSHWVEPTQWLDPGAIRLAHVFHHVIHWLHGGKTKLENLCLLCAHHHTLVHDGTIRLPDWVLEMAGRLPNRE